MAEFDPERLVCVLLPLFPMGRNDFDQLAGFGIRPSFSVAPAREDKRVHSFPIQNREAQIAVGGNFRHVTDKQPHRGFLP